MKTAKKLLFAISVVALVFTSIFAMYTYAADDASEGLTFEQENDPTYAYPSETYLMAKKLEEIPVTLEAVVLIPSSLGNTAAGPIMGNYLGATNYGEAFINYEIYTNRNPRIWWGDEFGYGHYSIVFDKTVIPADKWTHVAFTYDNSNGVASCYVNGELSEVKYFYPKLDSGVIDFPMYIGADQQTMSRSFFKGSLKDVAVFSDVRTAEEVKADYTAVSMACDNLLCYFDIDTYVASLKNGAAKRNIPDASGNGYDLLYNKTWLTEAEMEEIRKGYGDFESDFSFAVFGDTQKVTENYPNLLAPMYEWVVSEKENKNIVYSIGLGDITDDNGAVRFSKDENGNYVTDENGEYNEWDVAKEAITKMNGIIPYSLVRGNHDNLNSKNHFNEFFSDVEWFTSQFTGENGGTYTGDTGDVDPITKTAVSYGNTWCEFVVSVDGEEIKYLFINLDYGACDRVLAWASDVCEAHPDHKVIINTHGYLHSDGTTLDLGDPTPPAIHWTSVGLNNGDDIWNELVSKHANIEMVLSGHISANSVIVARDNAYVDGVANTVTQMLINPQGFDYRLGGAGMVAMLYFDVSENKIAVEYYCPTRNMYLRTVSQFVIDLDDEGKDLVEKAWDGTSATAPEGSGTESDPYLVSSPENLLWMSRTVINKGGACFEGEYFKQTCDIDLDGEAIQSIGYYYLDFNNMSAFSGNYDGCGYSIKNGTVASVNIDDPHSFDTAYGHGLFGVIYGAVIENVVLEDIEIVGRGVSGAIVGRAASPEVIANDEFVSFNVISGCEVKSSVNIVTLLSGGKYTASAGFDNTLKAGRVGSICGMAHATLIEGCTSDADMHISGLFTIAGGIAGSAGLNTVINNCAFTGSIELVDNTATSDSAYGGIVGAVSPSALTTDALGKETGVYGDLTVSNSYTTGVFTYTGGASSVTITNNAITGYTGGSADTDGAYTETGCSESVSPDIDSAIAAIRTAGATRMWYTGTTAPSGAYGEGIKYLDRATSNYYVYSSGSWTKLSNLGLVTNSLETPYGDVTAAYATSLMAVFEYKNGGWSFYKGYDSYYSMLEGTRVKCQASTSSRVVVYFRGDVTMDKYTSNIAWNVGSLTFDLGGNTLYQNTNEVFPAVAKYHNEYPNDPSVYGAPGSYEVKNGNIVLNTYGLFNIGAYGAIYNNNANNDTVYKVFNYTFKDVNVSLAEGSALTGIFGKYIEDKSVCINGTQKMELNVKFEDGCTFDISNATEKTTLFNANDVNYTGLVSGATYYNLNSVVHIEVGAVNVIAASKGFTWFSVNKNNGSSVVFDTEGGKTVTLTVPTSVTPTTNVNLPGKNGYIYDLEKTSESDGKATYGLATVTTPYGAISSTYASVADYPFVVFSSTNNGATWTFKKGFATFAAAVGDTVARSSTNTNFVSVVYVRANAATTIPSSNSNWTVGKMIIDLAGHTLTPSSEFLYAWGKYGSSHTAEHYGLTGYYEIINGEIVLNSKGLLRMGTYGEVYEKNATSKVYKTLSYSFKNVKFTLADGATLTSISGTFDEPTAHMTGTVAGEENKYVGIKISYDDNCVFDISKAKNTVTLFDANDKLYEGMSGKYYNVNNIVNIEVGDVEIITGDASFKWLEVNEKNSSSVTISKDCDFNTEYGIISEEYYKNKMVFFLKDDATGEYTCVYGTDLLSTALSQARAYTDGWDGSALDSTEVGRTVVMVFTDNVTDNSDYTNTTQSAGNVIIDLNGYTLYQSTEGSTLFSGYAKFYKTYRDCHYTVKNGNVVLNDCGIFTIGAYGDGYVQEAIKQGYYKTLFFTFDNVNFSWAEGATAASLMGRYNESTNIKLGINGENTKNLFNVDFNNCTFDMTNAPEGTVLFDAKDTLTSGKPSGKTYYYTDSVVNITVNGGSIIGTNKAFTLYQVGDNGSSVTFDKLYGSYVTLALPKGTVAPSITANNGALVFLKISESTDTAIYTLAPVSFGEYAPKTSITLGNSFVMNVYVPKKCTQEFTFNGKTYNSANNFGGNAITVDGETYYLVTVDLGSSEAAKEMKLVAYVASGETTATATYTFSIPKYSAKVLANESATEVEKTLVKDTLAYIKEAYEYFGTDHNTAMEIERAVSVIESIIGDYSALPKTSGEVVTAAPVTGVTLVLGPKPTIRFYVTDTSVTFSANGRKLNTVSGVDAENGAYVELDVYAYALSETISYTGGGSYHVSDFINGSEGTAHEALVNAFVKYVESAADYRRAVIGK